MVNEHIIFSRVATKLNSAYNMMIDVRAAQSFRHNILRSLLIKRFVGQRSRSQLLKIEQTFDTFFVSA